jgi:hypothetical protein
MQKSDLIKFCKPGMLVVTIIVLFVFAKRQYSDADPGNSFGTKAVSAEARLLAMKDRFGVCAGACNKNAAFMQAIVFPELMRYSTLKDGIESESLRVLYVQLGKAYADFSVGPFQMKPSFAEEVETKAKALLPDSIYNELQLRYDTSDEETTRSQRLKRLLDEDWQLIYLTAFISVCDTVYQHKLFSSAPEKLQWYATVYNAGFNRTDAFIEKKIAEDNFYFEQQMPGKKFKYAAIATWFYHKQSTISFVKQ